MSSQPNVAGALRAAEQHLKEGRWERARAIYREVLAREPNHAETLNSLGVLAHRQGRHKRAEQLIRRALAVKPTEPTFHNSLGAVLLAVGRPAEAIPYLEQAVRLQPRYALAHYNLGLVLGKAGQRDAAIACYRRAIELRPHYGMAHSDLGVTLAAQGKTEEAMVSYDRAIKFSPSYAPAHINRAHALLRLGRFKEGWEEYEWRRRWKDFPFKRDFAQPEWDGHDLAGRTILLHTEQGFGDTIQYIRYVPLVVARGGRVVVECQPELHSILQAVGGAEQVIAKGQPLPSFDVHASVVSLPLIFGTTLDNIPAQVPYLAADPARVEAWRTKTQAEPSARKVGLAWRGRPTPDPERTCPLARMAPLGEAKGVIFHSLQKDDADGESKNPPPGLRLVNWSSDLKDFGETAALIHQLDLVISIDTAVAHLAGALGKPVWLLLPFVAASRWLLEREDSPWYPMMRLFGQPTIGDWDSVAKRVRDELIKKVRQNSLER